MFHPRIGRIASRILAFLIFFLLFRPLFGQQADIDAGGVLEQVAFSEPALLPDAASPPAAPPTQESKNPAAPLAPQSRAEAVTQLERANQTDAERLEQARCELDNPQGEYRLAEHAFRDCDEELNAKKAELAKAVAAGDAALKQQLEAAIADIEKKWALARERFDLAIEHRRTLQEQIAALEAKLKKNKDAAAQLLGAAIPTELPPAPPPASSPTAEASSGAGTATNAAPAAAPAASPSAPVASPFKAPIAQALFVPESAPKPPSKALLEAQNQLEIKRNEALVAKRVADSIMERIAVLDKDIELESKLLAAARKKADVAFQTTQALDSEYEKAITDPAEQAELTRIWEKRREAQSLFRLSREESRQRSERLEELHTQRASLQRDALAANMRLEQKQQEVLRAEVLLAQLQNPYSLRNTLQWAIDHLPKIALIILVMFAVRWATRLGGKRVIQMMVQQSHRGTTQEREDRARTLVSVFRNALSITVTIGGVLMICEELGLAIAPLMGGAAVFGLAIAFGAQNLIRDYFYGFVILIENQYKLNDILRIGDVTGQVEQITLRMTVLRDAEGNVHFIPNGKIDSVTNLTHGWSRAIIEVRIGYKENADFMMQVLTELAFELKQDPLFGQYMIDDPEMLGVDALGESAVTLKLMIKTRPFKQWAVRREMLRRIKRRFDEMGVEYPYPHRILFHRHESSHDLVDGLTICDPSEEDSSETSRRIAA